MDEALHPDDLADFGAEAEPALRRAVHDLSWLLGRGYSHAAALRLVGDRHQLTRRQRKAASRCAASEEDVARRLSRRLEPAELAGRTLHVDAYNVLLTVVSGVLGAPILVGRDGVARDVASLSRLKRRPDAMDEAVRWTADALESLAPGRVVFHLDRPLSGSGELRGDLERFAREKGLPWEARLDDDPDGLLKESTHPVATGDSAILDAGPPWFDLARFVVERHASASGATDRWVVDLS